MESEQISVEMRASFVILLISAILGSPWRSVAFKREGGSSAKRPPTSKPRWQPASDLGKELYRGDESGRSALSQPDVWQLLLRADDLHAMPVRDNDFGPLYQANDLIRDALAMRGGLASFLVARAEELQKQVTDRLIPSFSSGPYRSPFRRMRWAGHVLELPESARTSFQTGFASDLWRETRQQLIEGLIGRSWDQRRANLLNLPVPETDEVHRLLALDPPAGATEETLEEADFLDGVRTWLHEAEQNPQRMRDRRRIRDLQQDRGSGSAASSELGAGGTAAAPEGQVEPVVETGGPRGGLRSFFQGLLRRAPSAHSRRLVEGVVNAPGAAPDADRLEVRIGRPLSSLADLRRVVSRLERSSVVVIAPSTIQALKTLAGRAAALVAAQGSGTRPRQNLERGQALLEALAQQTDRFGATDATRILRAAQPGVSRVIEAHLQTELHLRAARGRPPDRAAPTTRARSSQQHFARPVR